MFRNKVVRDWLPVAYAGCVLWAVAWMSGCAVSAQFMTDRQHRDRTEDRVLTDRAHGSGTGDHAVSLDEYRARYVDPSAEASARSQ